MMLIVTLDCAGFRASISVSSTCSILALFKTMPKESKILSVKLNIPNLSFLNIAKSSVLVITLSKSNKKVVKASGIDGLACARFDVNVTSLGCPATISGFSEILLIFKLSNLA